MPLPSARPINSPSCAEPVSNDHKNGTRVFQERPTKLFFRLSGTAIKSSSRFPSLSRTANKAVAESFKNGRQSGSRLSIKAVKVVLETAGNGHQSGSRVFQERPTKRLQSLSRKAVKVVLETAGNGHQGGSQVFQERPSH